MKNPVTLCLGRARITVPGPANVTYAEQEIDGVQLSWVKLDPGQTLDAAWTAHVDKVAHDPGFRQGHASLLRRMSVLGRPALLRQMYDIADSNNVLEMWAPMDGRVLAARVEGAPSETALMQQLLERVVPAVHPGASERRLPQDFCMDGAVVRLAPEDGEAIGATIGLADRAYTLDVRTEVLVKEKQPGLLARYDREMPPFYAVNHVEHNVLRRRKLTWNQSAAEEIVDTATNHGAGPKTLQSAELESAGIGGDAYHPSVTLHLKTDLYSPHPAEADLLGLWDEITASVVFDRAGGAAYGNR